MEYNVREIDGKFYPEYYDEDLGWLGYKYYTEFLSFDDEGSAWNHITDNPNQFNIDSD